MYDGTGNYQQLSDIEQVSSVRICVLRFHVQLLRSDRIPGLQLPLCHGSRSNASTNANDILLDREPLVSIVIPKADTISEVSADH